MRRQAEVSKKEWKQMVQDNPELENETPKMNLIVGGQRSTKVKYGEEYTSLAGKDWKKVLLFSSLEGVLLLLTFLGMTLGIGLIMMGTFRVKEWEAIAGGILVAVGVISGGVAWHLHDRI